MKAHQSRHLALVISLASLIIAALACLSFGESPGLPTTRPPAATNPPSQSQGISQPQTAAQPTSKSPGAAQPVATRPPVQPQSQSSNPGSSTTIRMINGTNSTICYVYMSGTWESEWGSDWLGQDVVYSGDQYTFNVNAGNWDLMATDCDGNILEEAYNIGVPTSGLTWTVDSPTINTASGSLTINNDTPNTVCYVYMGPPNSEWSGDLLGNDVIDPYSSYTLYDLSEGTWCISLQDCSNNDLYYDCSLSVYAGASLDLWEGGDVGDDTSGSNWTITNMTGIDACYLYISSSNDTTWGSDFLGSDILYNGNTWNLVNYTPGYYDIKLEDCSHNVIYQVFEVWIDGGEAITAW